MGQGVGAGGPAAVVVNDTMHAITGWGTVGRGTVGAQHRCAPTGDGAGCGRGRVGWPYHMILGTTVINKQLRISHHES